jgi:hypothetical protein
MQVSCSPMASWMSTAVTALSTPPDKPQMTCSKPTCFLMRRMASSLKDAMDQLAWQPQMSMTNFRRRRAPSGVWITSRWNWVP